MSEHGHDLHSLFPHATDRLHHLKLTDAHFRNLADRYHDLVSEISRIIEGLSAASDARLEDLKKQRLALLDTIGAMIAPERTA
ncbi:DUF465 domain-containing protein [Sphingobium terrigena]|uniref:DUF465 domain-containing protein n=1 Tax=Sphingobium terrigena TaxID=2304063 RepID=A0A418YWH1_9SPHN|nr:DUF465 domain-containing protein [Sphingobium terrigena]RJG56741.1 DUF465 domain-containing protein [Sphingobium terrigena]